MMLAGHVPLSQRPSTCRRRRPRLQVALVLPSLLQALSFLVFLPCLVPTSASNRLLPQRLRQSSPPGLRALSFRLRRIFRPRYPWRPCPSRVRKEVRLRSRILPTSYARRRRLHWSPTLQPTE